MKTVELDLFQFGINVTDAVIQEYGPERGYGEALRCLRFKVAGERQRPFRYETPASWWQQFKVEHFPKWALNRWPAKTIKHELTMAVIYPKLETRLPRKGMGGMVTVIVADEPRAVFLSDTDGMTPLEYRKSVAELMRSQFISGDKCPTCNRLWFEKWP
jgi:hypothetical protein